MTKLTDLPTAAALQLALNAKQDTLTFDDEPTALSQNPVTSGGIYTAIQAVATALSDYSETTDGRLNVLEGLVPTEASSSNKLTDKAYVDGLIQAITELIPAEADTTNQLADKAYVLAQILAATPAFKGQFTTLAELQAVASPKAGDLGIVRTKDSDGMDVFTVYQYLSNAWNVFYSLSYHPQTKPATTGTTGDYPYNGMGRVELAKNIVNSVNTLTQDMFYKGAVGSRVPNTNTIFVIRYDYVLGEDITIPDNCVLEFDGGSISGAYTITGNGCHINGTPNILCSIVGIGNQITHLSWFTKSADKNAAFNRAVACAGTTTLDGDNERITLSETISFDATKKCDLLNLVVEFTATSDGQSMFLFDTSVQYTGHHGNIRHCIFTMTNPSSYKNVHCIHYRRWDSTTRGKIDDVQVIDFTGYMFLCESYLQEFSFERFKGTNVGGFISFNKEYGNTGAFGDYGTGSSNILTFTQCGIDSEIASNSTITDIVDLTKVIVARFDSCVFQGNVNGRTIHTYNISRYDNGQITCIEFTNSWSEFVGDGATNICVIGTCVSVKSDIEIASRFTFTGVNSSLTTSFGPVLQEDYANLFTIASNAFPTINIVGSCVTSFMMNIVAAFKDVANISINANQGNGYDSTNNLLLYKEGFIQDLLGDLWNIDNSAATKKFITKGNTKFLRQTPTVGTGPIYVFPSDAARRYGITNPKKKSLFRMVYRVYPLVAVTSENLSDFNNAALSNSPSALSGNGDNPFVVGQSTDPEQNPWREVLFNIRGSYIGSIQYTYCKYAYDIAVCEVIYGDYPVGDGIIIDPNDPKNLINLQKYETNDANTSERPTFESNTNIGASVFDKTIGKPIWWTGTNWVDATGTTV